MKTQINRKELIEALTPHLSVVTTKPMLPILECVKMDLKGKSVSITSSSLEITMRTTCELLDDYNFSCCVPLKMLSDTLRAISAPQLSLFFEKTRLTIATDNGRYTIPHYSADDFPKSQDAPLVSWEIRSDRFFSFIDPVIHAAGDDELRIALTAIRIESDGETLTAVATDAHRLVSSSIRDFVDMPDIQISKGAYRAVKSALSSQDIIGVAIDDRTVHFVSLETRVSVVMIDASYPAWRNVIPEPSGTFSFNKADLQGAVKRVSAFASDVTHAIILESSDSLVVKAADLDGGKDADESTPIDLNGISMRMGVNSKYLIELLSNLPVDELTCGYCGNDRALLFTSETNNGKIVSLLMPVMI